MQEILIDRRQLVPEDEIEEAKDLGIAGNARMRGGARRYSAACASALRLLSSISSIVSWHRPQFFLTPQRA
ncbi:MAG TPA: hypothetical protein VJ798_06195 [Rhizomicrobium sp.]|nr:hypothetical protein [Rhizomicrobium sp.]